MFKLNIECTKDIDELHINFSDGTATTVSKPVKNTKIHSKSSASSIKQSNKRDILDTDINFESVSQEIVSLPDIGITERAVNVAEELQNLDI